MFKKFKDVIGLTDLENEYEDEIEETEKKTDFNSKFDKRKDTKHENKFDSLSTVKSKTAKPREKYSIDENADLFIITPKRYDDCAGVIDELKRKKTIVLNLEELELEVKRQVFEFVKGSVYALEANIQKVSSDIFVIAPYDVEISGKLKFNIDKKKFTWE
jgi:cell division inhibitor SepF